MSVHTEPHPDAGRLLTVTTGSFAGHEYRIEDWWDRIAGRSWMVCDGNPAALAYALNGDGDPIDDEVVYGKIGGLGHLIHVRHLGQAA